MFNWLQHLFTARALQQENSSLQKENSALKSEIEVLKKKSQPIQHVDLLEEIREKMLVLISKQEGITESAITAALNINAQLVKFHIQELANDGLAGATLNMGGAPARWSLMQAGRRYLASHGLLT